LATSNKHDALQNISRLVALFIKGQQQNYYPFIQNPAWQWISSGTNQQSKTGIPLVVQEGGLTAENA